MILTKFIWLVEDYFCQNICSNTEIDANAKIHMVGRGLLLS